MTLDSEADRVLKLLLTTLVTINRARELLGQPPLSTGDVYWADRPDTWRFNGWS